MNSPDLNLLEALNVLLTQESVAGAARQLQLSASAMSRTLSRLRAVTGDPLLVRAGRHMVLTPHAQSIRERTQQALSEAQAVLRPYSTKLDLANLEHSFTIRANDSFVEVFGPLLISQVKKAAPLVRLCFAPKPEKNSNALRQGLVDLEIGVLSNMGPEIRLQTLFKDRFVAVVRKGHPLEYADNINAKQYVSFGHVVASRRGKMTGPVDAALAELNLHRDIVALVPNFSTALTVAQTSDLVALVPASFLSNQDSDTSYRSIASLHSFELPLKIEGITVSQMWHPRSEYEPAHRWLRQLVFRLCRQHVSQTN